MSLDLSSDMYGGSDQLAKLSSTIMMCIIIGSKQYNHLVLHQACDQMDTTTLSRLIMDRAWKSARTEAGIAWVYVDHTGQLIYQNATRVNPLPCPIRQQQKQWPVWRLYVGPGSLGFQVNYSPSLGSHPSE
ncbi:hypothetical protein LOK49_LG14G02307 [Camellia lanceoleosa]|uniref:Uncharacterized protein n=1 Tax=Camellia lanceoleosa TaxID=1840588 RepID=A0ACC0F9E9_9ERIC|nr:hypothetical protein LOK49_LG14G02307 [Camellia lanceoleosa]